MKKKYTLLALTISFSINAQWEFNSNGGWGIQTNFSTASDYASFAIGHYNLLGHTVTNSATEFSTENTAFVIGNGFYDASKICSIASCLRISTDK
ncbi:MAG: hypothetical protein ACJ0P6_04700 [Flavobacteriaceae bacterium]